MAESRAPRVDQRAPELFHVVAGHNGPIFMLYFSAEEWRAIEAAHAYGLQLDISTCMTMVPEVEPQPEHKLNFCRCQRTLSP